MNPALAELKDIHLPATSPWWALAYGWWLLAIVVVVLLFWGVPRVMKWYQGRRRKTAMTTSILSAFYQLREQHQAGVDTHQLLAAHSTLLRRVAITLFPKENTAGLIGAPWIAFLDSCWGNHQPPMSFSHPDMEALVKDGAYRASGDERAGEQIEELLNLTEAWLNTVVKDHV